MAIIKGYGETGVSGHVGSKVFYHSLGKDMERSMPRQYTDRNNQTQRNQRFARFKPCLDYCRQLKGFVKSFYQTKPAGRTAFAEFMKSVILAFGGTELAPTVNLQLAFVGNGDMPKTPLLTCTKNAINKITITWGPTQPEFGEDDSDVGYVVISKDDLTSAYVAKLTAPRSAETETITVPPALASQECLVSSVFFTDASITKTNTVQMQDINGSVNLA